MHAVFKLKTLFFDKPVVIDSFESLSHELDTEEKVIAMLVNLPICVTNTLKIQNMLQSKNADRRNAIATGEYLDPFEGSNAISILKKLFVKLVKDEKSRLINEVITRIAGG